MGLFSHFFQASAKPAEILPPPEPCLLTAARQLYVQLATPVMLTDPSGTVVYLNPALQQLLRACQGQLQQRTADFNLAGVEGGPAMALFTALEMEPGLRLVQAGLQQAHCQLDGRQWQVRQTAIDNVSGQCAGFCIEFSVVEPPVAAICQQATSMAYQQFCANLPTCAMLVDQHDQILFANDASKQLLQNLQTDIRRSLADFNISRLTDYPVSRLLAGLGGPAESWHSAAHHQQAWVLGNLRMSLFCTVLSNDNAASIRLVQLITQPEPDQTSKLMDKLSPHLCLLQTDPAGKLIYINDAMAQLLNASTTELIGKDFLSLWSTKANQAQRCKTLFHELKNGQTVRVELLLASEHAGEQWLALELYPLQDADGRWSGVGGVAQQITSAKLETIDRIGQMKAINLTQAVIEFTLDGTILHANENFLATVGYQLNEIQGRHHSLFVDEQYKRSAEYQMFWQRLRAGEFFVDEYKRFGKGGKEIWIQASYNPIFDADGKPFKVVKYATNITNRKIVVNEIKRVMSQLSVGDLRTRIEQPFEGEFAELGQAISTFIDNLRQIISDINHAAETIKMAATEISEGNLDLSSRTEQQASSLEETASSMEQLTSTVRQNSDNSRQANVLAGKASEVAVNGGQLIEQVVSTMGSINESAQKISDIIGVIDGIAFQTNILALNAAVEAARAGEQGRGFAVVASEVRTLAQRSANAAKDIKGLISDSVNKIRNGNELVDRSGATMKEVVVAIQRVNDLMAEVASASAEQAGGIDEINKAVTQMDDMTQQNAALVEEAAAASASLLSQAEQLYEHVAMFIVNDTVKTAADPVAQAPRRSAPVAKQGKVAVKPAKAVSARPVKAAKPKPARQLASDEEEWEAF